MTEDFNNSCVASNSDAIRKVLSASVVTSDNTMPLAAGAVIQRGILRSTPSGPRIVIGRSILREAQTTSNSLPANGWNG